jgi:hypothetical protein
VVGARRTSTAAGPRWLTSEVLWKPISVSVSSALAGLLFPLLDVVWSFSVAMHKLFSVCNFRT